MIQISWTQIVRYGCAGSVGFVLYFFTFFTMTAFREEWYLIAAIIGGVIKAISDFVLQKVWAFERRELRDTHKQAGKYLLLVGLLFTLNIVLLSLFIEWLFLNYILAQILASAILTVISFFITRLIFLNRPE